jgi:hypothetical protein
MTCENICLIIYSVIPYQIKIKSIQKFKKPPPVALGW